MRSILFLVFLLLEYYGTSFAQIATLKVVKVKDGDTFVVMDSGMSRFTIRLLDVDCPENGQDFGNKAKLFAHKMLMGSWVKVKLGNKDKYKRTLAIVYLPDGTVFNELLVRKGLAWPYLYDEKKTSKRYKLLMYKAKTERIGLWQRTNPTPPWEYRKPKK